MLQGRYAEALATVENALVDVDKFDLQFARPHLLWTRAAALLGLRRFGPASNALSMVEKLAAASVDIYLELNIRVLRARLLLTQQRPARALDYVRDDFDSVPARAMCGEYLATRALAQAIEGCHDDAEEALAEAGRMTRAVETLVLSAAVRAVGALGRPDASEAAGKLLRTAGAAHCWDGVICALRASRPLLEQVAQLSDQDRFQVINVLVMTKDKSLAHALGAQGRMTYRRSPTLSERESEVLDLLSQGLRSREIAQVLYISDVTVKAHVRHIFEKLGAHTRAEAVARAFGQRLGDN
jgi:ATP/maltotriose-dependent transcriptional regulator MalT